MAKKDTVAAIKAANGTELNEADYTQDELDALLALAQGRDDKRKEFDEQAKALKGSPKPAAQAAAEKASQEAETSGIRVKVSDKGTGSYIHPVSKTLLRRGGDAVSVPDDAWTQDMVAKRFLTEARK